MTPEKQFVLQTPLSSTDLSFGKLTPEKNIFYPTNLLVFDRSRGHRVDSADIAKKTPLIRLGMISSAVGSSLSLAVGGRCRNRLPFWFQYTREKKHIQTLWTNFCKSWEGEHAVLGRSFTLFVFDLVSLGLFWLVNC